MTLFDGTFVEFALWNRTTFWRKFLDMRPLQTTCIRYNSFKYLCLISNRPKFVDTDDIEVLSFERKVIEEVLVKKGRTWMETVERESTYFMNGKEFLKDYTRVLSYE